MRPMPFKKARPITMRMLAFPYNITGITDHRGVRVQNVSYDAEGRATLSELAGGVDRTTVAYTETPGVELRTRHSD